jgi:hypothetical protein
MIATALVAAQLAGTFEVLDRTDVRLRSTEQIGGPQQAVGFGGTAPQTTTLAVDLSTIPTARVRLRSRRMELAFSYSPMLTAPDVTEGQPPIVLHAGTATLAWHGRFWTVSLSETASYGEMNSALLQQPAQLPGQPVQVQVAPQPGSIHFGSSSTDLLVTTTEIRRLTLSAGAGYFLSGGLDAPSRDSLPLQQSPRANASAAYRIGRTDNVTTSATASRVEFQRGTFTPPAGGPQLPCAPQADIGQVLVGFRHALSPSAALSLGAGLGAAAYRDTPDLPYTARVYPAANGSYTRAVQRDKLAVAVGLSPTADARTGTVNEAVQASATLEDRPTGRLSLRMTATAGASVPQSQRFSYLVAGGLVEAAFRVDPHMDLMLGEQALWQDQSGGLGGFLSSVTYVAVGVRAVELHF